MESAQVFFKKLLLDVVKKKATSLHLSVGGAPMMRVFGEFIPVSTDEIFLKKEDVEEIINSFLSEAELEELKEKKEILIVKNFGENFRFRIRVFYQKENVSLSLNYISEETRNMDDLGFPDNFRKELFSSHGLLMVAGSANSGKTSTISSIIEKVNIEKKKYIITLEKPIEKIFVNKKSIIEQRQVGRDVNSYVDGLKHALEEDVDIVYIDDIKEGFDEALPYILELASGNSLVILEINAENSVRALEKILNIKCKDLSKESVHFILADVLFGIISQKLIPNRNNELSLVLEILMSNFAIKSLIREGNIYQVESIIQNSFEEGMISMEKSIKELIKSGKVDEQKMNIDV